jgi:pimeloyl-ACP methyl ester carboxylesterase
MITAEILPAEGARYTASLLLLPDLWAGPGAWRACASFLAHRGWECHLLDPRRGGGIERRATAVVEYAAAVPGRTVLVAHAGGAALALAVARRRPPAAVVLIAPLLPGSPEARTLALRPRALLALLTGADVPPPHGRSAALVFGDLPEGVRATVARGLAPEEAEAVRDVLWGRLPAPTPPGVPTLVVSGDRDPLLPVPKAADLARALGGRHELLAGAGHWPLGGPAWLGAVDVVHRWLVRELGEELLDLYAEAMAERDEGSDDEAE